MPASTPQQIHVLFEQAFNLGDLDAIVALYEPHAVLVINGESLIGHDAIRHAYSSLLATRSRMQLVTRSVIESAEDLALLYGAWSVGPPSETQGMSTEVVRRQPAGHWLFAIDNPYTPR